MAERESIRRQRLVEYLKRNLGKGYDMDSLKWALIRQGNSRTDVESAINLVKSDMPKKTMQVEKPEISREVYDFENNPVFIERKPWWKFW